LKVKSMPLATLMSVAVPERLPVGGPTEGANVVEAAWKQPGGTPEDACVTAAAESPVRVAISIIST